MSLKSRTSFTAAAFLGLGLAGCGYTGPDEETTDVYVQRLLLKTEDAKSLVGTYNVMVDPEQQGTVSGTEEVKEDSMQGRQLGVIFVDNIEDIDKTNSVCADYTAYAAKWSNMHEKESRGRTACVPK